MAARMSEYIMLKTSQTTSLNQKPKIQKNIVNERLVCGFGLPRPSVLLFKSFTHRPFLPSPPFSPTSSTFVLDVFGVESWPGNLTWYRLSSSPAYSAILYIDKSMVPTRILFVGKSAHLAAAQQFLTLWLRQRSMSPRWESGSVACF